MAKTTDLSCTAIKLRGWFAFKFFLFHVIVQKHRDCASASQNRLPLIVSRNGHFLLFFSNDEK